MIKKEAEVKEMERDVDLEEGAAATTTEPKKPSHEKQPKNDFKKTIMAKINFSMNKH